ncbi:hypothetical protein D9756_006817 [Leucocoprinus leucothites]|uniref:Uncharacterized protein n=1 Tax=Leucocoprinus leucothites TaxID=201217 RepID=A0A8H5G2H6_9AGAR|nr:hypothetical protein D9756_006817 [Leucoagaricus leucothites]
MPSAAAVWGAALLGNYRNGESLVKRETLITPDSALSSPSVAGATLFIYDSLIMFPAEIEEKIYCHNYIPDNETGWHSVLHWIPVSCLMAVWVTALALDIGYTSIIKLILVLRLRAIYRHDRKVSIILYTLMTIEMIGALGALIGFVAVSTKYPAQVPFPFVGCWSRRTAPPFSTFYDKTALVLWYISHVLPMPSTNNLTLGRITRFSTTAVEAILMLTKLGEALNKERRLSDKSLLSAILELRRLTPVLYIFYRDGALLFIPIFIINTLGILGKTLPNSIVGGIDWSMWLLLTYQICGSRLILNIRRANEKLTGSMVPQYLSTLRFESRNSTSNGYQKPGQAMAMSPLLHYRHDSTSS